MEVHSICNFHSYVATVEVLQRAVNHYCIDHECDETDGFFGNATLHMLSQQTSWYSLLNDPSWSTQDQFPSILRAIVNDLKCNYHSYALDHYTSQSIYMAQNLGNADPVDAVIKLEESKSGLESLNHLLEHKKSKRCTLRQPNKVDRRPPGIPSNAEISEAIKGNDDIMRDICLVYIQVSLLIACCTNKKASFTFLGFVLTSRHTTLHYQKGLHLP